MYTVLVPVDGDEDRARTQADFLTNLPVDHDDVELLLTHVLVGEEREAPEAMRSPDRVGTVRQVREAAVDAGYETQVIEASLPPAEGILSLARERDVDQVVLAGRKRSPAGKTLFGSVTQKVILNTDIPVTVTGKPRE